MSIQMKISENLWTSHGAIMIIILFSDANKNQNYTVKYFPLSPLFVLLPNSKIVITISECSKKIL